MNRLVLLLVLLCPPASFAHEAAVKSALGKVIVGPRQSLLEAQDYIEPRIAKMPEVKTAAEWTKFAEKLRQEVIKRVVLRGEAWNWAQSKLARDFIKEEGKE